MSLKRKLIFLYILSMIIPFLIYTAVIGTIHHSIQEDYSQEIEYFFKSEGRNFAGLLDQYFAAVEGQAIDEEKLVADLSLISDFSAVAFEVTRGEDLLLRSEDYEAVQALGEVSHYAATLHMGGEVVAVKAISREPWEISDFRPPRPPFILWLIVGYAAMHLLFLSIFLRNTLKPLEAMKNAANHIKEGQFDYPLPRNREDEIGEVFDAFSEMQLALGQAETVKARYELQRKEMIANISHDLRTPITAIQGYADGISDGIANTPAKIEKYLSIIRRYAGKMEILVDNLSTFSRLDISQIEFRMEGVLLKDYMQDCLNDYEAQFTDKGIDVSLEFLVDPETRVRADRDQIRRVIDNIMQNAQRYLDKPQGRITLRVGEDEDWIVIAITDNGRGIPEGKTDKIFQRFYRVDEARSGQGNGIGLSIAKSIIESHGGRIWARSVPGEWTRISFTLRRLP